MPAKPKSKPAQIKKPKPASARAKHVKIGVADEGRYHHGDLHGALLNAAEKILERDGLPGLTLRAVAREAGVSHAAPTHHFGDLTGLVSELAAIGFRDFNAAMVTAGATGHSQLESSLARARAYLAYARARPGMYLLMFRIERLDMARPALRDASEAAFAGLAGAVNARFGEAIGKGGERGLSLNQAAQIARSWSLVHGFTTLLLDGRLFDILERLPEKTDPETLFDAMLKITVVPANP